MDRAQCLIGWGVAVSVLDPVYEGLHAIGVGVGKALESVAAADQAAQRIGQHAEGSGFVGIAQGLSRVRDSIREISARVSAVNESAKQTQSILANVPEQATPQATVAALTPVQAQLDSVHSGIGAALAKIDETKQLVAATLHGGQPGPMLGRLDTIRQTLLTVTHICNSAKQQFLTAVAEAKEAGGQGNLGRPGDASSSANPARPTTAISQAPQGLTVEQYRTAINTLRTGTAHIGGEIFVHGSRAAGTARPGSDIDFGVRVTADRFHELVTERFGRPNLGSAKERTMQWAIQTGKIQFGEAGLSRGRRQVEAELDMDVDLSVIRSGGPFDTPPSMEVPNE
jgi:hypothetical protein